MKTAMEEFEQIWLEDQIKTNSGSEKLTDELYICFREGEQVIKLPKRGRLDGIEGIVKPIAF